MALPHILFAIKTPLSSPAWLKLFFQHFGIRLITVSSSNHKSLLAEHGIKSLAEILKMHLSGLGPSWTEYLDFAMLSYNSYSTPNLDGLCLFKSVFGCKPNVLPLMEAMPEVPVVGTFHDYYCKF